MKKFLIIALALMLALALVACNKNKEPDSNPNEGIIDLDPNGSGTGDNTNPDAPSDGTGNSGSDIPTVPNEETFTDLEQTIFVVADAATIRSDTYVSESTQVDYTAKGTEFKSIAYSANWFKIEYVAAEGEEAQICYLHKSVVCVKDLTAVDLEEPLTVYVTAYALYVRSYYDFDAENNLMCTLAQGDEVIAVAKGDGWYKIQLADDAQGNEVFGYISSNEKYVSTTKPEGTSGEETSAEETTVVEDNTTEEATTEAAVE